MNAILEGINSAGREFVGFAGPMLVQSSVLIVILLIGDFLLRRKVRAVLRYWLWMLVLVKLVLPISLATPVSLGQWFGGRLEYEQAEDTPAVVSEVAEPQPMEMEHEYRPVEAGQAEVSGEPLTAPPVTMVEPAVTAAVPEAVAITPVTWEGWLFLGWLAGVVAMGLLLVQRAIFVMGLVAQAKGVNGLMGDTLKYCCGRMGVKGEIGLKVSANATSPAVCGLFRPVILVPQDLGPNLGAGGLRVVLMHELAHIRRGDLWVNLVQTVLQIVYFYNPLLWAANAVIRRVREQAVDEAVQVAMGEKAGEYPETLVRVAKLAFERPALSLRLIGVVESKSTLQSRVRRMLERPLPKSAKLGFLGLAMILVVGAILLPMAKGMSGPPEFVIKGRVTAAETGLPIAGAKVGDVEKYADGQQWTTTDSDGNYGYLTWYEEHGIKAEAEGYKSEHKGLYTKLFGSEKEKVVDFALRQDGNRPKESREKQFHVVWWMAGVEKEVYDQLAVIAQPVESQSKNYVGYSVDSEKLVGLIIENRDVGNVIFTSKSKFLKLTSKYRIASSWADSGNLDHSVFVGYSTGGAGPYKLLQNGDNARLELEHETVSCLLNSGSSVQGAIFYDGDIKVDDSLVFAAKMPEKEASKPYHLVMYTGTMIEQEDSKIEDPIRYFHVKVVKKSSEYKATLTNGITVELVGVCEHPSFGKQWWVPNGDLLEEAPYDDEPFGRAFPRYGEKGYKFAVKLSGLAGKDLDYKIMPVDFQTTQGGGGSWPSEKNGQKNVKYKDGSLDEIIDWIGTSFLEEKVNCDIIAGVCFGEWKDKYKYETDKPNDAVEWVRFENVSLLPNFDQYEGLSEKEQIVKYAESQARLLNHEYIGTEHILLGLVAENSGIISDISKNFGITREAIYNETLQLVKKGKHIVYKKTLPMTPRAKLALKSADQLAKESNSVSVNSQHVLLGLLQVEDGVGAQVLMNLGLNLKKAQEAMTNQSGQEASEQKTNSFAAILQNGVTVELVGVCEHPSKNKQWWAASGESIDLVLYDYNPGKVYPEENEIAREMAVKLNGDNATINDAHVRWEIPNSSSSSGSVEKFGQQLHAIRAVVFQVNEKLEKLDFKLGIAAGKWRTQSKREIELTGGILISGAIPGGITWNRPSEPEKGVTAITVVTEDTESDIRIVAVNKNGKIIVGAGDSSRSENVVIINADFDALMSEIKEFQYRSRPYEWVEFKNVSLEPNFKTAVQVEVEKAGVGVEGEDSVEVGEEEKSIIRAVDNKATLQSGITVELLGLTYIPVKGQPWWKPDGSLLEQPLFEWVNCTPSANSYWKQLDYFAVAYRLGGVHNDDIRRKWALGQIEFEQEVKDLPEMMTPYMDNTGAYIGNHRVTGIKVGMIRLPKSAVSATIQLGVTGEDWRTIASGKHTGFYEAGNDTILVGEPPGGRGPGGIVFGEKGLHIGVGYNITDRDFRVVAVDKNGKIYLSQNTGSGGTDNLRRTTGSFPDLEPEQLEEYRFQVRKYDWVEFRDITLRPGDEAIAEAEKRAALERAATEQWLGEGQMRRIRELILTLRETYSIHEVSEPQVAAITAMRELVRIGSPAVPELCAELRRSERRLTKRIIAFVLRAIGDRGAVGTLIEVLGESRYRGGFGVFVGDEELAKFMLDNQYKPPSESDREAKAVILACPVIEITAALEKITGHSEGHEHWRPDGSREGVQQKVREVAERWRQWWDKNGVKAAVGVEGGDEILSKFFSYVDSEIEQLAPDYPQLVEWDVKKTEPQWWGPGKMVTTKKLVYNHALSPSESSNYRDWYGQNGCHVRIGVFTEEEWNRLEGPGIKTEIFGLQMGQFFVAATVITEKPEVPELEQKINDIIRSAVINTNQNPDVQVGVGSGVVEQASGGAGEEESQGSKLEFRILPDSVLSSRAPSPLRLENEMEYRKDMRENGPDVGLRRGDEYIWLEVEKYEPAKFSLLVIEKIGEKGYVLAANLKNKMMLADGTWGLQKVYPKQGYMGRPGIGFEFDEKSDDLFYQFTSSNINNQMAIIIGDKVYSAPQINSAVRGEGIITGDFTEAELAKVIVALKKGMPAVAPKPRGQQPGFDPVVEITINDNVAVRKNSLIDFDTGKLFSLPDDWRKTYDSNKALQWIISNGVDAFGATRNTVRGLDCEGMIFASVPNSCWDKFQARSLATSDLWKLGKPGRPAYMTGEGELPATYIYKTREGGIGILQITGFNDEPRGIKIRYKMLKNYQKSASNLQDAIEQTKKIKDRLESSKKLQDLGGMLLMYADDHNYIYPDSLNKIKPYDTKGLLAWLLENVEYLGNKVGFYDPFPAVLAYDKTLLKKGEGTNVLFNTDLNVTFRKPEQLKKLIIPPEQNPTVGVEGEVVEGVDEIIQASELGAGAVSAEKGLQGLIDAAKAGETVIVPDGVYTEPVRISKSLKLKGQSLRGSVFEVTANEPAIFVDAKGKGKVSIEGVTIKWQLATSDKGIEHPFAVVVKDTRAEVKGCNFVPLGNPKRSPVAIRAMGFSNLNIEACRFEGFEYVVCYGEGTEGVMSDSLIMDCGHQGVILYSGAKAKILRNVITGSRYHAVRSTGGTLDVRDNLLIENANRGIYLGNKSARGVIANNIIMGNGTGISGFARSRVRIQNNIIADSSYAGISMRDSCSLSIRNNILHGNAKGCILQKEGSKNANKVFRNLFWENEVDVENFDKPAVSISAEPGFVDPDNGDFSLNAGEALEHKQGLTDPNVFKILWKRWENRADENEPLNVPVTKTDSDVEAKEP